MQQPFCTQQASINSNKIIVKSFVVVLLVEGDILDGIMEGTHSITYYNGSFTREIGHNLNLLNLNLTIHAKGGVSNECSLGSPVCKSAQWL